MAGRLAHPVPPLANGDGPARAIAGGRMPYTVTRNTAFWTLQIAGWGAYGLSKLLAFPMDAGDSLWVIVKGIAVTCALRGAFHRLERRALPFPVTITAALLASLLAAKGSLELSHWASVNGIVLTAPGAAAWLRGWEGFIHEALLLIAWSALYLGIGYALDLHHEKERLRQALADTRRAQAQMLRYQLNPHFLFNALASLRASVGEDPQRAERMITDLSGFLHFSLSSNDDAAIPLQREFDLIGHYMAIQKVRFEERIDYRIELDPRLSHLAVPPFLVQPLVENAVKYGMRTSTGVTRIEVDASGDAGRCVIQVRNSGHWVAPGERPPGLDGIGIGLANLRQRLAEHFPGRHTLETGESAGQVLARLELHGLQ